MPPRPVKKGGKAPVRSKYTTDPLPTREVVRDSNFFITVNTNYVPRNDADAQRVADDLSDAIERVFSNPRRWQPIFVFRDGAPRDFSKFLDIEVDWRPEVAPKTGAVHAHILVEVKHKVEKPGLHLSREAIKKAIREASTEPEIRDKNLYVNIKGFSSRRSLREYITKGLVDTDDARLDSFSVSGSLD